MVRKSGKWKCLSFIKNVAGLPHTISGGADVVKPITSHDIQYEGTGNILLAKGVRIQLNDAQSNGKP